MGRAANLLGFAGLLPQAAALALVTAGGEASGAGAMLAFGYGALILSFLGGIWWAIAMRRTGTPQALLATVAVVPSLVPLALGIALVTSGELPAVLVALGVAILMTLPIDARLARLGEAPAGWLRLRVPLSVGLGALTIAAGALLPHFAA